MKKSNIILGTAQLINGYGINKSKISENKQADSASLVNGHFSCFHVLYKTKKVAYCPKHKWNFHFYEQTENSSMVIHFLWHNSGSPK